VEITFEPPGAGTKNVVRYGKSGLGWTGWGRLETELERHQP